VLKLNYEFGDQCQNRQGMKDLPGTSALVGVGSSPGAKKKRFITTTRGCGAFQKGTSGHAWARDGFAVRPVQRRLRRRRQRGVSAI